MAPTAMPGDVPHHSPRPDPPPLAGAGPTAPAPVAPYDTAYGARTLVHMPQAVFTAALALGYHHVGDFYTPEGTCAVPTTYEQGCPGAGRWT